MDMDLDAGCRLLSLNPKTVQPVVHDTGGLEHTPLIRIVYRPFHNAPHGGLELVKLHLHSGPGSCFVTAIRDGLGMATYPVKEIQLKPGDSILLIAGLLDLELPQELPNAKAGLVLRLECLEVVNSALLAS